MRDELIELLDVLRERVRLDSRPLDPAGLIPIHSHATYGLYEIIAAYDLVSNGSLRETREGVAWVQGHQSDLFFITLNKADEDYSRRPDIRTTRSRQRYSTGSRSLGPLPIRRLVSVISIMWRGAPVSSSSSEKTDATSAVSVLRICVSAKLAM